MDRESVERLRFDTRLARRRDWVEESQVEQYLESLPDVSGKMATLGDLEADGGSEPAEAAAGAPVSESFGGSSSFGGGGFGGGSSA